MIWTILLAVAVPLGYLYAIHWLDLYGTERPKLVLACVAWGLVAFLLSFAANRFCIDILGFSRPFVSTRTAPFVEEVFKAGILIYLVRQAKLTYFVDGAIYGFASGIGFAAIENLRYIQLFPDDPLSLVIVRDFSSALAHGTATALTGIGLGSYTMSAAGSRRAKPLIVGLAGAMGLHYAWNIFANYSPLPRDVTQWVLVGVGLAGMGIVAATIMWGLRRERMVLHDTLGIKLGVSAEEASVVQHMDELDVLLDPIEKRFGSRKRSHVEDFLHLEAQLGIKEEIFEKTGDPVVRAELGPEIAALEKELDAKRREVGVYVMLYVRSIFPETAWSIWARLAKALEGRGATSGRNVWTALSARPAPHAAGAPGMYTRMQVEVDARARAAALTMSHVGELPEAMQKCLHWVMKETHVTAEHVAAGIGHPEEVVRAMMHELTERGFVHHAHKDGEPAFRARIRTPEQHAARPHVWKVPQRAPKPKRKRTRK